MYSVFTYGLLTHPAYMVGFTGRKAYIKNATLEFNYFANVNLNTKTDNKVWGVLWDVTSHKLDMLDITEGVPDLYRRVIETVYLEDDTKTTAYVYVMTPRSASQFRNEGPTTSYLSTIECGYKYFDIPSTQLLCPTRIYKT